MGTLAIFYTACRLRTAFDEFGGLTLLSTPQIPTSYTITKDASSSMMGMATSDRIVDSVTKPIPNL